MQKLMIITLGTGQGVENGIAKSIVVNSPEQLTFIATRGSLEQQMPDKVTESIKTLYHKEIPHYEIHTVKNAENVEEAYRVTLKAIESAKQQNYAPEDIYLDFTSGTKAMSVGAALAAFLYGCKTMVYIGGFQRDPETGRVITGSEVVMTFTLNDLFAEAKPQSVESEAVFRSGPKEINL